MKEPLKTVSEIVAQANDLFSEKSSVDTIVGIMDKKLRQQGMNTDAITIDCLTQDKKIVLLMHDEKPDKVSIDLGNQAGDIISSSDYELSKLSIAYVVEIMEVNFLPS